MNSCGFSGLAFCDRAKSHTWHVWRVGRSCAKVVENPRFISALSPHPQFEKFPLSTVCRLGESFREDSESAFSVHPQRHILQIRIHSRPLRVNKKEIKSTRSIHCTHSGKIRSESEREAPKGKMLIRGAIA